MVKPIVFIRHGESEWNLANRFTGWTDVALSAKGTEEAKEGGVVLKEKGFKFDQVYTSVLKRAKDTCSLVFESLDKAPTEEDWRLNERHYGALQGLNKSETAEKHGEDQVKIWRRAYDIPPPALEANDERHPANDPMYKDLPKDKLPATECLKDCVDRVLPFWHEKVVPQLKDDKSLCIVAHGNSLRAICMYLEDMTKEQVLELNIPTGIPLVYELSDDGKTVNKKYYLCDEDALKAKLDAVANQGKKQ